MLPSTTLDDRTAERAGAPWLTPMALAAAAGLFYAINLGRLPHPDELHHALAARGLLADGTPAIAEGVYTRGLLYTWMVAGAYALFGDSLAIARLPSLLCMAALVGLMFAWLRHEAGSRAAWIGTVLFAVSPFAVDTAQFARFYAPQCLALFVGAALVHAAVLGRRGAAREGGAGQASGAGSWRPRLALAAIAVPPLLLAVYFQPTTLIGMAGIGVWAVAAVGLPWLADAAVPARRRLAVSLGAAALGLFAVLVAWQAGILEDFWRRYRWTPLFNQDTQNQFWFYHAWFSLLYPTLWPLTGVLGLVAVVARPRAAAFALTVFALAFLLNSIAAAKSLRYLVYAQPFLFAVWGIGLAVLWPPVRGFLSQLRQDLGQGLAEVGRPYRRLSWVLLVGAALFLLLANPAWLRTTAILADVTVPPELPMADWPRARPALEPWLTRADVVVTTEELASLYFLGRFDIRFSRSKLDELDDAEQREFGIDFRTGRPVISTTASLTRVFACFPSGVILGPQTSWNNPKLIDPESARLIEAQAQPIPLPPGSHMFAYRWDRPADRPPPPADCADLPRLPQSPTAP